jgi:hypothetical protein
MKKILLSLSALLILGLPNLSAQLINADFETWTPNPNNGKNAPDPNNGNATSGWWDFNVVSNSNLGGNPITVYEGTTNPAPNHGSHYAAIVSDTMSTSAYNILQTYQFPYARTYGILFTGYENVVIFPPSVSFKTGIPVTGGELNSFSFNYRYVPNGSDSCSCSIGMYHWDAVNKKRTLIGGGYWGSTSPQTSWKSATIPIVYSNTQVNPDTILIVFSACALNTANKPKQYDTLDIDNSSVTGIGSISAPPHDNVNLYPNPAQTEVNLVVSGQYQANRVEVYYITGKMVGIYSMTSNSLTINTQSYTSGLYLYKLLDNTGVQLNVGKFSVVK